MTPRKSVDIYDGTMIVLTMVSIWVKCGMGLGRRPYQMSGEWD